MKKQIAIKELRTCQECSFGQNYLDNKTIYCLVESQCHNKSDSCQYGLDRKNLIRKEDRNFNFSAR